MHQKATGMSSVWVVGNTNGGTRSFERGVEVYLKPNSTLDADVVFYRGNPVCDISCSAITNITGANCASDGYNFLGVAQEFRSLEGDLVAVHVCVDGETRKNAAPSGTGNDQTGGDDDVPDGRYAHHNAFKLMTTGNSQRCFVTASARVLHNIHLHQE